MAMINEPRRLQDLEVMQRSPEVSAASERKMPAESRSKSSQILTMITVGLICPEGHLSDPSETPSAAQAFCVDAILTGGDTGQRTTVSNRHVAWISGQYQRPLSECARHGGTGSSINRRCRCECGGQVSRPRKPEKATPGPDGDERSATGRLQQWALE